MFTYVCVALGRASFSPSSQTKTTTNRIVYTIEEGTHTTNETTHTRENTATRKIPHERDTATAAADVMRYDWAGWTNDNGIALLTVDRLIYKIMGTCVCVCMYVCLLWMGFCANIQAPNELNYYRRTHTHKNNTLEALFSVSFALLLVFVYTPIL